jgi:hypothetical protein
MGSRKLLTVKAKDFASVLGEKDSLKKKFDREYSNYVLPDLFWQRNSPGADPFEPDLLLTSQKGLKSEIRIKTFTNIALTHLYYTRRGLEEFCRRGDFRFYLCPIEVHELMTRFRDSHQLNISLCYGIAESNHDELIFFPSLAETTLMGQKNDSLTENARPTYEMFIRSLEPTRLAEFNMKFENKLLDPSLQFSPQNKNSFSDVNLWE